jgi:hypothetical protein
MIVKIKRKLVMMESNILFQKLINDALDAQKKLKAVWIRWQKRIY